MFVNWCSLSLFLSLLATITIILMSVSYSTRTHLQSDKQSESRPFFSSVTIERLISNLNISRLYYFFPFILVSNTSYKLRLRGHFMFINQANCVHVWVRAIPKACTFSVDLLSSIVIVVPIIRTQKQMYQLIRMPNIRAPSTHTHITSHRINFDLGTRT